MLVARMKPHPMLLLFLLILLVTKSHTPEYAVIKDIDMRVLNNKIYIGKNESYNQTKADPQLSVIETKPTNAIFHRNQTSLHNPHG